MIELKSKILGVCIVFMLVAILATPVMAVSPKKIPVTITKTGFGFTKATIWTTGNMIHGEDMVTWNTGCTILGDGVSLTGGTTEGLADFHINQNNGKGNLFYEITLKFAGGNFIGHQQSHGTFILGAIGFPNLIDGITHDVYQGTDEYQGWTLSVLTETINKVKVSVEAYMLIP